MKNFSVKILFSVLLGAIAYTACRKTDKYAEVKTVSSVENRFFNDHKASEPLVQALTLFMSKQNNKYKFVERTVKQIGYPLWDKSITVSGVTARGASDSANITYIPFVRDSQNFVNASLIIKTTATDTSFKYLCDWQYATISSDSISGWSGRNVFHVFAKFDQYVFGRNQFKIIDQTLMTAEEISYLNNLGLEFDSANVIYSLDTSQNINGKVNLWMLTTWCDNIYTCIQQRMLGFRTSTMSACPSNSYLVTEVCTDTWVYIPSSGGGGDGSGGGTTGGGGSGSGNGGPPNPPCDPGVSKNNLVAPCGPGWEPPPTEGGGSSSEPNPCSKVASLKSDNSFKAAINDLKSKLTDDKEHVYLHKEDGSWPTGTIPGIPNKCEVSVPLNTAMQHLKNYTHTHNNACELPIFGPDDLKTIGDIFLMNKNLSPGHDMIESLFTFSLVTDRGVYVLVIDKPASLENFMSRYFSDDAAPEMDKLTRNYKNYNISRANTNEINEENFLLFLKSEGIGVRLLKASDDLSSYSELMLNKDKHLIPPVPCPQ